MRLLRISGSLRTKLLAIPVVALLIVFAVSGFFISGRVQQALLANENSQLAHYSKMLTEMYDNHIQVMTDTMKMTVVQQALYDGYFGAQTEDFDFLKTFLKQTEGLAKVNDVLIIEKEGTVMLRAASDERGDTVSFKDFLDPIVTHAPIIDKSTQLDEVVVSKLMHDGDTIKLITAGPVLDVETVVGAVAFVKLLNVDFLAKQKPNFGKNVELSIATEDRILATTLSDFTLSHKLKPGNNLFDSEMNERPFRHSFSSLDGARVFLGISYDISQNMAARSSIRNILAVVFFLALGIIVTVIMLNVNKIVRSVYRLVEHAENIAEGDFTKTLDIKQKDEIGTLAKALNSMGSNLRKMFQNISDGVETLTSSSTELSTISQQMSSGAEQSSSKSNTVSAAAEEMSSNMSSVAAAVEQASTNTNMIASSSEQLVASINEIAQNSEKARSITGNAVSQAKNSAERVAELGKAAQEVSKVTQTITEISEQTNLLALNATIEAARAGEAGKGFAVVANEIKELARQTADATDEIRNQIEGIQNSISGTITDIEQVPEVINEVNEIVSTIATAVEEQSVTTNEIAGSVSQASKGITEITENVAQSSNVTGEIAQDISEVNQAANDMANSSSQVNMSAGELSKLAEQLKEMVGQFKV